MERMLPQLPLSVKPFQAVLHLACLCALVKGAQLLAIPMGPLKLWGLLA